MIDQAYISQLEKQYINYLKCLVLEKAFEPIVLRGGKNKPSTTAELHQLVQLFQHNEKKDGNKGWTIEWEEWSSKKLGRQKWPSAIKVSTEDDFLYLIKKEKEVVSFKAQLEKLVSWNPVFTSWISNKPKLVLELKESWDGICAVVDYLLKNDVKNRYLRSIPVPVHTKFIEAHNRVIHSLLQHFDAQRFSLVDADLEAALLLNKKPFLFKLRWLDENLALKYSAGMDLLAVPVSYLQQQQWAVRRVILVENETNLFLFTPLPGTVVICSNGKALHLLKEIEFLHHTSLYYWGDLDEEGFSMLNDIRNYYPQVLSLFMDELTLNHHQVELNKRVSSYKKKPLSLLQIHENAAYQFLLNNNQWLEQERLQQAYLQNIIGTIFN